MFTVTCCTRTHTFLQSKVRVQCYKTRKDGTWATSFSVVSQAGNPTVVTPHQQQGSLGNSTHGSSKV